MSITMCTSTTTTDTFTTITFTATTTTMETTTETTTTSATATTSTTAESTSTCRGKGANGFRTNTNARCTCADKNCFDCDFSSRDDGSAGQQCNICKNKKALLGGKCVSNQACTAEGGSVSGDGNFRRRCLTPTPQATTVAPRCTNTQQWASTAGNTCATYELGFNRFGLEPERLCTSKGKATPAFSKLMAAIHSGGEAPAGGYTLDDDTDGGGVAANDACCACGRGSVVGVITTRKPTTAAADRDSILCSGKKTNVGDDCLCAANCHTCTVGPALQVASGQCSVCKNARSLFAGNCIESNVCEGITIKGTVKGGGNFNRKCVLEGGLGDEQDGVKDGGGGEQPLVCVGKSTEGSPPQPCTCPTNCHTCRGNVCSKCKNMRALLNGQCIATAACNEAGGEVKGTGNFNRKCEGGEVTQHTTAAATPTPTPTTTTAAEVPCPTDSLDHFNGARVGVRLKAASSFVLHKIATVGSGADCAAQCIAYGTRSECKAFELKARGGMLRCNLLTTSSTLGTSMVSSAKYDLYDRSNFCS